LLPSKANLLFNFAPPHSSVKATSLLVMAGRSGSSRKVDLPRMKVVLAIVEAFFMVEVDRREDRRDGMVRKMVEDILVGDMQVLVER